MLTTLRFFPVLLFLLLGSCRFKNPVFKKGPIAENHGARQGFGDVDYIQTIAAAVDGDRNIISAGAFYLNQPALGTVFKAHITVENDEQKQKWSARVDCDLHKASSFQGVAVDGSGNIYAAGYVDGNGTCTVGTDAKLTFSGSSDEYNFLLIKFSANGKPLWARTAKSKQGSSAFESLCVDDYGRVFAAGWQTDGKLDLDGETTNGPAARNILIAHFSPGGSVKWARTAKSAERSSTFSGVAVTSADDVYAVGHESGPAGTNLYGDISLRDDSMTDTPLMVRYDTSGDVVSAYIAGKKEARGAFKAVAADASGNVYVAGEYDGQGPVAIGQNIVTGKPGRNSLVAKFRHDGQPVWAKELNGVAIAGIALDANENLFAAGDGLPGNNLAATEKCREPQAVAALLDKDGSGKWRRSRSCGKRTAYTAIATLGDGRIYVAGMGTRDLYW